MKRIFKALSAIGLALFSNTTIPNLLADTPDNVAGNWTIYSSDIRDNGTEIKGLQIVQYGNRITGYFEGPVQSGPIEGEVKGHHIRFSTVTRNVFTFHGQIYGNNMSGTYGIHGKHAAWQAVRTQAPGVQQPPVSGVYSSQPVLTPPAPVTPVNYAAAAEPQQVSNYGPTPAPLSADQLDTLVAPIALYPDSLVAQVLAGATFPDQVSAAQEWLAQNANLTGPDLAKAVDQQSWDPSVKALTQFPSVLSNLAKNLSWTSSLGQAFHYQQADVMAAIQTMRAKAQAAGNLKSSSQITVTQPASNTIVIQPANPQVVYVPEYNPAIIYGQPLVVPYYYAPPVAFASASISFGSGIAIGAFFGGGGVIAGGGFGWGFHSWGMNWGGFGGGGGNIIYNHNTYITKNVWNTNHYRNTTNNYNGYHPWRPNPNTTPTPYPNRLGPAAPRGNAQNGQWANGAAPSTRPSTAWNGAGDRERMIGGNGGVDHATEYRPSSEGRGTWDGNRNIGAAQNRSRFSGDGFSDRKESFRGHRSMMGRAPHMNAMRAPAQHFRGGGRSRR